ncbi:MAG: sulfatase [Planctomycetaceae bacterium]|nr:sulfatase [Planctomycetaceae bacterium]
MLIRNGVHFVTIAAIALGLTLPGTAADSQVRPNILFCIADDASWLHMGAYGCSWVETPGFDRVAREGLLFRNCYTPNAKCAPSRACILTGRNSWQLEAACNHFPYFPTEFRTYAEVLGDHGYHVGCTAKGWAPGVAVDADGKPRELTGTRYNKRTTKPPTRSISNNDYASNFVDFLNANEGDRPWCFWYGSMEPHRGYEYGSGAKLGGKSIDEIDAVPPFWPDNETVRNDLLDYAFEIEYFDSHLVRMLNELDQRGLLDNTIVVVTADNGMPFPRVKGQEYELSNHLPLAIMWPKGIQSPGREVQDLVSFIDFAPTFLAAAGVTPDASEMASVTGRSLIPAIFAADNSNRPPHRDFVLIGKERHDIGRPDDQGYPIRGIVKDGWLYLRNYEPDRWPAGNPETGYLNCDGSPTKTVILEARRSGPDTAGYWKKSFGKRVAEELYRIDSDLMCMNNLASAPEFAEQKRELAALMAETLRTEQDPRTLGKPDYFEKMPYSDPKTVGFFQRFTSGEPLHAGWVNPGDFEQGPVEDD